MDGYVIAYVVCEMAGCISGTLESCRWSSGAGRYAVEKKNRWAGNWPHICSLGEHEEEFSAGDRHSHQRTPKVPLWTRESCDGRRAACSRVRALRTRAFPIHAHVCRRCTTELDTSTVATRSSIRSKLVIQLRLRLPKNPQTGAFLAFFGHQFSQSYPVFGHTLATRTIASALTPTAAQQPSTRPRPCPVDFISMTSIAHTHTQNCVIASLYTGINHYAVLIPVHFTSHITPAPTSCRLVKPPTLKR